MAVEMLTEDREMEDWNKLMQTWHEHLWDEGHALVGTEDQENAKLYERL